MAEFKLFTWELEELKMTADAEDAAARNNKLLY
jgi:hypothetical protein